MSGWEAILYVVIISTVIALFAGFTLRKKGYTFAYYFISVFIASVGILGIVFKIIMDYSK